MMTIPGQEMDHLHHGQGQSDFLGVPPLDWFSHLSRLLTRALSTFERPMW